MQEITDLATTQRPPRRTGNHAGRLRTVLPRERRRHAGRRADYEKQLAAELRRREVLAERWPGAPAECWIYASFVRPFSESGTPPAQVQAQRHHAPTGPRGASLLLLRAPRPGLAPGGAAARPADLSCRRPRGPRNRLSSPVLRRSAAMRHIRIPHGPKKLPSPERGHPLIGLAQQIWRWPRPASSRRQPPPSGVDPIQDRPVSLESGFSLDSGIFC